MEMINKIYKNLEIWKRIEEYPDYKISNQGRVKSYKYDKINGIILKLNKDSVGYFYVVLYYNGKGYNKYIHHLVYETFHNYELKNDECVHHDDENIENNNFNNLIKMTLSEHSILHNSGEKNGMFGKHHTEECKKKQSEAMKGKHCGENNPRSTLKEKDVIEIWRYINEDILTQTEIGEKFGVSRHAITKIKKGKTWKYLKI